MLKIKDSCKGSSNYARTLRNFKFKIRLIQNRKKQQQRQFLMQLQQQQQQEKNISSDDDDDDCDADDDDDENGTFATNSGRRISSSNRSNNELKLKNNNNYYYNKPNSDVCLNENNCLLKDCGKEEPVDEKRKSILRAYFNFKYQVSVNNWDKKSIKSKPVTKQDDNDNDKFIESNSVRIKKMMLAQDVCLENKEAEKSTSSFQDSEFLRGNIGIEADENVFQPATNSSFISSYVVNSKNSSRRRIKTCLDNLLEENEDENDDGGNVDNVECGNQTIDGFEKIEDSGEIKLKHICEQNKLILKKFYGNFGLITSFINNPTRLNYKIGELDDIYVRSCSLNSRKYQQHRHIQNHLAASSFNSSDSSSFLEANRTKEDANESKRLKLPHLIMAKKRNLHEILKIKGKSLNNKYAHSDWYNLSTKVIEEKCLSTSIIYNVDLKETKDDSCLADGCTSIKLPDIESIKKLHTNEADEKCIIKAEEKPLKIEEPPLLLKYSSIHLDQKKIFDCLPNANIKDESIKADEYLPKKLVAIKDPNRKNLMNKTTIPKRSSFQLDLSQPLLASSKPIILETNKMTRSKSMAQFPLTNENNNEEESIEIFSNESFTSEKNLAPEKSNKDSSVTKTAIEKLQIGKKIQIKKQVDTENNTKKVQKPSNNNNSVINPCSNNRKPQNLVYQRNNGIKKKFYARDLDSELPKSQGIYTHILTSTSQLRNVDMLLSSLVALDDSYDYVSDREGRRAEADCGGREGDNAAQSLSARVNNRQQNSEFLINLYEVNKIKRKVMLKMQQQQQLTRESQAKVDIPPFRNGAAASADVYNFYARTKASLGVGDDTSGNVETNGNW